MGDKQFSSPNAYAGNRRGRKVAAIAAGICALGASVIVLIAFMMNSNSFTTVLDRSKNAEDAAFLHLKSNPAIPSSESDVLIADPIDKAWTTTAKTVLNWYDGLKSSEEGLIGTKIFTRAGREDEQLAWCNSFYLDSTAPDKTLNYQFKLSLSNYQKPSNDAVSIYNYLRIVVCIDDGQTEERLWYAARSSNMGTSADPEDYREAVSTYIEEDGYRVAQFKDGTTSYCDIFDGDTLVTLERSIVPSITTRYSIIAYLEGNDPDCRGNVPQGENFVLKGEFALI